MVCSDQLTVVKPLHFVLPTVRQARSCLLAKEQRDGVWHGMKYELGKSK